MIYICIFIIRIIYVAVARKMFIVFLLQLYEMNPRNCHRKKLGDDFPKKSHNTS